MATTDQKPNIQEALERQKQEEQMKHLRASHMKTLVLSVVISTLVAGFVVYNTIKYTESDQIESLKVTVEDLNKRLSNFNAQPQEVQVVERQQPQSNRTAEVDSSYYQALLKIQFEFRENEQYIKNQASKYARAFAYDNEETNNIIKKWVAPKAREEFRKWLVFAIKKGIDKSNESTLRRIEYRRKAKSFEYESRQGS